MRSFALFPLLSTFSTFSTFAIFATLALVACARQPVWYDNPPLDGERWYAVGADLPGNHDGAVASGQRLIAMRLGAQTSPGPAFPDERLQTLAGTPTIAPLPVPPVVSVEEIYDGERATRALVSFDRTAYLLALDARLQAVDAALAQADTLLSADGNAVGAVRLLRASAALWPEREALVAARRQLDAANLAPTVERPAQLARVRAALSRIPVALDGDQAVAATLPTIRAELFRMGWLAGDTGVVTLKTSLQVTSRFIDGIQRLDGILTGDIGGEPLRLLARGDGVDEALARDRLAANLGQLLANELDQRLIRLAEGN